MTRLYHPDALFSGRRIRLSEAQSHYLRHVLRAKEGFSLSFFNERDGEWSAVLETVTKENLLATVGSQERISHISPEVHLLFAPLKHDALTFLVEKATELGVREFHPVMTERCNVSRVNTQRLASNAIDASQQCERFDVPLIHPLLPLSQVLVSWDKQKPLFVCQERGAVGSVGEAMNQLQPLSPIGFLVGPEGGFSSQELSYLRSFSFIKNISLGPRILRAETAALSAISCYQALSGDWVS